MEKGNKLKAICEQATQAATVDLQKLIGKNVELGIKAVEIYNIKELNASLDREMMVAGVYVPISGQVIGSALMILPLENAYMISDLLVGREPGTTRQLNKLDESALEEVGNIIACSYFAVLGNALQIELKENPPQLQVAMFGALFEQSIANLSERISQALLVEIQFGFKPHTVEGRFILIFGFEELEAIVTALNDQD
jgi:chemotaxis protein CheC